MNRFAQLGYVVRDMAPWSAGTGGGRSEDKIGEPGRWEGRIDSRADGEGGGGKISNSLDDIQHTPRRVQDALRKEVVVGITASKMASACWTSAGDLFTWGTNSGQLGLCWLFSCLCVILTQLKGTSARPSHRFCPGR